MKELAETIRNNCEVEQTDVFPPSYGPNGFSSTVQKVEFGMATFEETPSLGTVMFSLIRMMSRLGLTSGSMLVSQPSRLSIQRLITHRMSHPVLASAPIPAQINNSQQWPDEGQQSGDGGLQNIGLRPGAAGQESIQRET